MLSQGQSFATGDAVNVAARLEQAAGSGEIRDRWDATSAFSARSSGSRPCEALALKGKKSQGLRLLEVLPDVPAFTRKNRHPPCVGREHELSAPSGRVRAQPASRRCQLVTVLGPPGLRASEGSRVSSSRRSGTAHVVLVGLGVCRTERESPIGRLPRSSTKWPAAIPRGLPTSSQRTRAPS